MDTTFIFVIWDKTPHFSKIYILSAKIELRDQNWVENMPQMFDFG